MRVAGAPLAEVADALLGLVAEDRHDDVALLAVGPKLPAEVFRRIFPADAEQLAAMRSELRAWLDRLACRRDEGGRRPRVHRGGRTRSSTPTSAETATSASGESENGWLKIEVSDDGRRRDPRPDDSGRGLDLVRTLIGDIDVERGERGTTVRMRVGVT